MKLTVSLNGEAVTASYRDTCSYDLCPHVCVFLAKQMDGFMSFMLWFLRGLSGGSNSTGVLFSGDDFYQLTCSSKYMYYLVSHATVTPSVR